MVLTMPKKVSLSILGLSSALSLYLTWFYMTNKYPNSISPTKKSSSADIAGVVHEGSVVLPPSLYLDPFTKRTLSKLYGIKSENVYTVDEKGNLVQ